MSAFQYNPSSFSLPQMPKIQASTPVPQPKINNTTAKSILESLTGKIKAPEAFTSTYNINDVLFPTQELGRQFIDQNLRPDYEKNVRNPLLNQQSSALAGSNLSMYGGAKKLLNNQVAQADQGFYDQAQSVQDQFNNSAMMNLNDFLKSYLNTQINF